MLRYIVSEDVESLAAGRPPVIRIRAHYRLSPAIAAPVSGTAQILNDIAVAVI
jgi:hypothetical protein